MGKNRGKPTIQTFLRAIITVTLKISIKYCESRNGSTGNRVNDLHPHHILNSTVATEIVSVLFSTLQLQLFSIFFSAHILSWGKESEGMEE